MRHFLSLLGVLAVIGSAATAEFPPPEKLPSNPGLPDPLTMFDGSKVTSKAKWPVRRKELRTLFLNYMYGEIPRHPGVVRSKVLFKDTAAFGGKGTLREVELTFENPEYPPLYLLVAVPNNQTVPPPVFVGTNFQGNHCLTADERVRIPDSWMPPRFPGVKDNKATEAGRGKVLDVWPFEEILARGFAVATFFHGDVQPDRPDVKEGLRAVLPKDANSATIANWAWGVHRAVDYLSAVKDIDGKRIAVVGHSRLGKTALVAAAFDDRIKMVIPSQAGCGGSGPSRHSNPKAETVKRINTAFPHWFCTNFKAFNDDTSKLPFDQNCLVALCAPRPVLFSNAEEDLWANPSGQFEVLKAANPAYQLLGVTGLDAEKMPPVGELLDSRLGFFIRPGKHSMSPVDWKAYMDFADKWLR